MVHVFQFWQVLNYMLVSGTILCISIYSIVNDLNGGHVCCVMGLSHFIDAMCSLETPTSMCSCRRWGSLRNVARYSQPRFVL